MVLSRNQELSRLRTTLSYSNSSMRGSQFSLQQTSGILLRSLDQIQVSRRMTDDDSVMKQLDQAQAQAQDALERIAKVQEDSQAVFGSIEQLCQSLEPL